MENNLAKEGQPTTTTSPAHHPAAAVPILEERPRSPSPRGQPWPEEAANLSIVSKCWQRWSYSFMKPLLDKGSRQTLDDGTHLSEDDLFRVPDSLKSSFLEQKFE